MILNGCLEVFLEKAFRPWDSIDLLDHQPDRNNIWSPLKIDYVVCVEKDHDDNPSNPKSKKN